MTRKKYTPILFAGTVLGLAALMIALPQQSAWAKNAYRYGHTVNTQKSSLDKIADTYRKHQALEADFEFRYFRNAQDQTGTAESGSLLLHQGSGKYRISLPGQILISDGASQWAVLKDADEVQVTEVDHSGGAITPSNVFSFFTEGYTHKMLPSEQVGRTNLDVIELTPIDKRKSFSKVIIRADRSTHQLLDVTIFDKNNSRYLYQIKNLKTNPQLADSQFVFNKSEFPGMEIVDLR